MDKIKDAQQCAVDTVKAGWNGVVSTGKYILRWGDGALGKNVEQQKIINLADTLTRAEILNILNGSPWIRIAGICGATAVAMGAYGAHSKY